VAEAKTTRSLLAAGVKSADAEFEDERAELSTSGESGAVSETESEVSSSEELEVDDEFCCRMADDYNTLVSTRITCHACITGKGRHTRRDDCWHLNQHLALTVTEPPKEQIDLHSEVKKLKAVPMGWKSGKQRRRSSSTVGAELLALRAGHAHLQ